MSAYTVYITLTLHINIVYGSQIDGRTSSRGIITQEKSHQWEVLPIVSRFGLKIKRRRSRQAQHDLNRTLTLSFPLLLAD